MTGKNRRWHIYCPQDIWHEYIRPTSWPNVLQALVYRPNRITGIEPGVRETARGPSRAPLPSPAADEESGRPCSCQRRRGGWSCDGMTPGSPPKSPRRWQGRSRHSRNHPCGLAGCDEKGRRPHGTPHSTGSTHSVHESKTTGGGGNTFPRPPSSTKDTTGQMQGDDGEPAHPLLPPILSLLQPSAADDRIGMTANPLATALLEISGGDGEPEHLLLSPSLSPMQPMAGEE